MSDLPKRKHLSRIPVWLPLDQPVIYFITAGCHHRQRLFLAADTVRVAVESLRRCAQRQGWEVPQLCLMPDHVHLFAAPLRHREQSLADFMRAWKSSVTLWLKRGPIWQPEFFDHLLRSDESAGERDQACGLGLVEVGDEGLVHGFAGQLAVREGGSGSQRQPCLHLPCPRVRSAQDAESLVNVLSSADNYGTWSGPKLCGGFHPDWAVEFGNGSSKVRRSGR